MEARTAKVGFLLTEVDAEAASPAGTAAEEREALVLATPASASSLSPSTLRGRPDASAALPLISVYRVEDAELPPEVAEECYTPAPLPPTIPMGKVMTNIVQNLDFKAWSENARALWYRDFRSPPSRAVISDTFWYCICWYFQSGKHPDVEKRLFDRISASFVALFASVVPARKDFFFRCYADAVAQAVLYALFLAYPKSRVVFTEKFRRLLVIRISFWTTGVWPEFVDTSHWKLNLGGGDVLQATTSQGGRGAGAGGATAAAASQAALALVNGDSPAQKRASLAHRAPRPQRRLRYSPLVDHFLRARKYSSVNLIRPTCMCMTTAEERVRLMDVKHAKLVERATAARENCDRLVADYDDLCLEVRRQERQRQAQAQTAKKRLEIRRKEVLRSDPHEYANYLVSLHLLQQGLGQGT